MVDFDEALKKIEEFNVAYKKTGDMKMLIQTIEFTRFLSDRILDLHNENLTIKKRLEALENGKRN